MTCPEIDERGTKHWYNDQKQLHRLDGPAVESLNGDRSWWVNGNLHRTWGPAVECVNGYQEWLFEGKLHRLDGPAIEWANRNKQWWIRGKYLQFIPKIIVPLK